MDGFDEELWIATVDTVTAHSEREEIANKDYVIECNFSSASN